MAADRNGIAASLIGRMRYAPASGPPPHFHVGTADGARLEHPRVAARDYVTGHGLTSQIRAA